MGYKVLYLKNFGLSHRSKIERRVNRYLEMMNHLTGMKIAWNNSVLVHIFMLYAQRRSCVKKFEFSLRFYVQDVV